MGIKNLNRFLREQSKQSKESIKFISVAELSGKKIAVDISIYMYKYASEGSLLENIYLMLSVFRYYNICPIFVFDGKPPPEKKELLLKRKEDKVEAESEYNKLKLQLEKNIVDDIEKQDVINNMDMLKKKFIYISKNDIEDVKNLIRYYGATYYDAPGEADELCALLVLKKKVWACLSEDMDLFVYGCTRVLRYFSLINHNIVLYYMKGILEELNICQKEFREICILSGTDYNTNANKYKHSINNSNSKTTFYEWLQSNSDYISDLELLEKINTMFDLSLDNYKLEVFNNIKIINGPIIENLVREIMRDEGFIFMK